MLLGSAESLVDAAGCRLLQLHLLLALGLKRLDCLALFALSGGSSGLLALASRSRPRETVHGRRRPKCMLESDTCNLRMQNSRERG